MSPACRKSSRPDDMATVSIRMPVKLRDALRQAAREAGEGSQDLMIARLWSSLGVLAEQSNPRPSSALLNVADSAS